MDTASVPLLNGCPLIYSLRLGHLLPRSCKTDTIDRPLLGDVKRSSIVCVASKLEEFPDADRDDTEFLSSFPRSINNLSWLLFRKNLRNILFLYRVEADLYHKNKQHVFCTYYLFVLLPRPCSLICETNFPQWFSEIDHSARISGYGSITTAAKMSMANY